MNWSNTKPAAPGWYWYRTNHKQTSMLMQVQGTDELMSARWPEGRVETVMNMPGEWSGPLKRSPL